MVYNKTDGYINLLRGADHDGTPVAAQPDRGTARGASRAIKKFRGQGGRARRGAGAVWPTSGGPDVQHDWGGCRLWEASAVKAAVIDSLEARCSQVKPCWCWAPPACLALSRWRLPRGWPLAR